MHSTTIVHAFQRPSISSMSPCNQERGLSIRTPSALRESSRRLKCYLILADAATAAVAADQDNSNNTIASKATSGEVGSRANEEAVIQPAAPAPAAPDKASGEDAHGRASASVTRVSSAVDAERLAQEAVELSPGDPRPWQALAEACDAQGTG